ncbi:CHAT domain-containing protein [Streptomyces sp. NPDC127105]|uniref:CHAT domain-containing tetratricopeptide repeat protein n=1 Tax=Streptomyces sp. NPDC127105 TaxID=3345359 RepID=UPI0036526687
MEEQATNFRRAMLAIGNEAEQARTEGGTQQALEALLRGVDRARDQLTEADSEAFGWYAYFGFRACELYESQERRELVIELAGGLWRESRAHGSLRGQLSAAIALVRAHAATGGVAAAVQHAVSIAQLMESAAKPPAHAGHDVLFPAADDNRIRDFLTGFAQHVYYVVENYPACIEVCRVLLRIAPDDADAAALIAFSMSRTAGHASAEEAYRRAIALDPERGGLHTGLTAALMELGRLDEALESQSRAIKLKPDDVRYRLTRGNIHQALGDHTAAIAEYDLILESLDGADASAEAESFGQASSTQDVWNLPPQELTRLVLLARLRSLAEVGLPEQVAEHARPLLARDDPATQQIVHRLLGDVLRRAGRTEHACDAYARAVAAGDDSRETRITLCEWLVECGRVDEAVRELSRMADPFESSPEPMAAREALAELVDRFPAHASALRARGQAESACGCPAQAVATFSRVLDRHPEDGWTLLWRGVALVSRSDECEPAERGWSAAFSLLRVRGALLDLAQAAHLEGDHQERAREAFGWLLERAVWSPLVLASLMSDLSAMKHLASALPALEAPFQALYESHTQDNPARRWSEAAAKLAAARAELELIGLPLLAALADAIRADSLIRIHRLQEALDALSAAEKSAPLLGLGPHRRMDDHMRSVMRNDRGSGDEAVFLLLEHLELTALVRAEMQLYLNRLRADAISMLGHSERALGKAGELDWGNDLTDTVRPQLQRARLLRDAGRHDEALTVLESLTDEALEPDETFWRDNLRVTVFMRLRRLDEARGLALRTLERIPADFAYARSVLQVNLAWILVEEQQTEEALKLLDGTEIGPEITWQQRKYWHQIRGTALVQLGKYVPALTEFRMALSIVEEFRLTLRGLSARMSWQAEHVQLHAQAMSCALNAEDVETLFELLERSKAQAFLDQLDADGTVLDTTSEELRAYLEAARARRAVLRELVDVPRPEAEIELLHTYERHGGRWSVDRGGPATPDEPVTASLVKRRLEEEETAVRRLESSYDEALVVGHEARADRVMDAREIADQLRVLGEERVLLVEYLVMDEEILVFFLRAGDTAPQMDRIDMQEPELLELVEQLLPPRTGGTSRPLSSSVLEHLAPLVEPVVRHSRPGDLLWVVPHRVLHQVPLHAVPVDGVPLLRTRSFCYTPSAAVLSRCQKARDTRGTGQGAAGRWTTALVLGDSGADLPHSRFEAAEVAALFGTRALVGSEAKASTLLDRVARTGCPDVLHLACHGRFGEERSLDSGVVLAPDAGALGKETVLTAEAVMRLSLNIDLVVLSACDSGRSEERAGDELIGLPRALLQAGTPSVLVSLWPVDDLATCLLMTRFYRNATESRSDATLADALRRAQLAVADLTAQDVLEYCDRRIDEAEGTERMLLQVDRADIQVLAGDLTSAVAAYRLLTEQRTTSEAVRRIVDAARRKLPLLELRAMAPEQVDYSVQPFSDPYYWASFVLVGDWR